MTAAGGPSIRLRPKLMATRRSTAERSACTMCSIHRMATPRSRMSPTTRTSAWTSGSLRPPAISSNSSTRGPVASARASSRRLRSSSVSAPARAFDFPSSPLASSAAKQAAYASRSERPAPYVAPTSTFSKTVIASNGWGIWCVSAMPARQRAWAGIAVMSRPSNTTAPRSGRRRPAITLRAVVLPAPLGPITPTASRSFTESVRPSRTWSEPKARDTSRSASSAVGLRLLERPQLAARRDVRGASIAHDRHVEAHVLATPPLAADQWRLGDVRDRALGPADRPDQRVEIGRLDGGDDGAFVVDTRRPLERVEPHLEQGVDEAERLRPLLLRLARVLRGEGRRAGAGQRRLERVLRRPPDLSGHAVTQVAQCLDRARKEQRLADGGDLRTEALLSGLLPERRPVRRDRHAGDDLDLFPLEGRDLRGEVVGEVRIAPGVDDLVAGLGQRGRKPALLVAPRVAVAVVGPERSHDLVRLHRVPHVDEDADDVLEPPEEVIGRLEADVRLAAAREEPRLPRTHGGDGGRAVDLALIGHGIGRLRRARDEHQVDLVGQDQAGGDLGRAVRIGLTVAHEDLDRMHAIPDLQSFAERLAHSADDEGVGLAESRQRPRLRTDVPDLDRPPLRARAPRHRSSPCADDARNAEVEKFTAFHGSLAVRAPASPAQSCSGGRQVQN